jgi:hypothetical protein
MEIEVGKRKEDARQLEDCSVLRNFEWGKSSTELNSQLGFPALAPVYDDAESHDLCACLPVSLL